MPLETSLPGVFAAGDVRHGSTKRVASAVGEGSIAIRLIHEYLSQQSMKFVDHSRRGGGHGSNLFLPPPLKWRVSSPAGNAIPPTSRPAM